MEILSIEGLPVNKNYHAGQQPAITNGIFEIKNNVAEKIHLRSIQLKIFLNEKEVSIPEFYIYKLPEYNEIIKEDFFMGPLEKTTVDISFPFIYNYTNPFNSIKIELSIFVNDKLFTGFSIVKISTGISKT